MLNVEKYKDEILKNDKHLECATIELMKGAHDCCNYPCEDCSKCREICLEWLTKKYIEPILTDSEKKYLNAVIEPFRNKVECIVKDEGIGENEEYIFISLKDGDYAYLPDFEEGKMFQGMENEKEYSLKELGI